MKRSGATKRRSTRPLTGRIAVVAGATRGAGRGIARALGEAGATVYCTGRSVRGKPSPYGRTETIEETAELVEAAGGVGVALRVDHTVEKEVRRLFGRIERKHGRLDVVVNCIAGEDPLMGQWASFWNVDTRNADAILRQAFTSHVITAKHAAQRMIAARRGLIVEVTESDTLGAGGNPFSQAVKIALKAFALNMAAELKQHGVAALSVTPGFLRSESMLERFGVTEENWRDGGKKDSNFLVSESPLYVGRAVAALAADPKVIRAPATCGARGSSRATTASPTQTADGRTGVGTTSTSAATAGYSSTYARAASCSATGSGASCATRGTC
jgi:NAD(P)-dependent dehydrogenase (short-subunit alcohol dehydrogenase family)